MQDPALKDILGPQHAAYITECFCKLLNAKASQNHARQAARQTVNGGNAGSRAEQAGGLDAADRQPEGGGKANASDCDMSETEVSASEEEQDARRMNGEMPKAKLKMKRADAKLVRAKRQKPK